MSGKQAYVVCAGCPESRIDSARIQNFLMENGWNITDKLEDADLVMFRGCGLTKVNVDESLQLIRNIKSRKKEGAQFIVWGCLSKINQEALRTVYSGVTFGEDEADVLNKILEAKKPLAEVVANSVMPILKFHWSGLGGFLGKIDDFLSSKFSIIKSEKIFQIKVSTGCLDNCSFCAVHISRGVVRSKSIDENVSEFRDGLNKGFRYFGLLATDLGAYGKDIGHNLVDLLTELTKEKGDYRIGLRNINPYHLNDMFEQLRPFFASGKIWFLSSAAESGSNRILKLMRRQYTIQEYIKCFRILNNEYSNIFLSTQLMVGFPTETNEDFQITKQLTNAVKFDWVEVYTFSPANGTTASTMTGQVPEAIKKARFCQLYRKTIFQHPHRKMRQLFCL